MAKVISGVSPKGGPGKTTTLTALAIGLSKEGNKVLAIDLDNIGSFTNNMLGMDRRDTNYSSVYDLFEGDENTSISPMQVNENLFLIQGDKRISNINRVNSLAVLTKLEDSVEKRIPDIDSYNYILVDTPAGDGNTVSAALMFADYIYSVITLDDNSISALSTLSDILKPIKRRMNPRLKHIGLVINQVQKIIKIDGEKVPEATNDRKVYNEITQTHGESILGMIAYRNATKKYLGNGKWIKATDNSSREAEAELSGFYNSVKKACEQ